MLRAARVSRMPLGIKDVLRVQSAQLSGFATNSFGSGVVAERHQPPINFGTTIKSSQIQSQINSLINFLSVPFY